MTRELNRKKQKQAEGQRASQAKKQLNILKATQHLIIHEFTDEEIQELLEVGQDYIDRVRVKLR